MPRGQGASSPWLSFVPPHVLSRRLDAAVWSQVRLGGWRGGATIPSNSQTMTSVPDPIHRGSRSEEAVPWLSLPPFCEGVCAPSQGTSRPGFCPFLDARPHPHPQKAHRRPHGLQGPSLGLFPVSSSTNFLWEQRPWADPLPDPSQGTPSASIPCTTQRLSPPHSASWLAPSTEQHRAQNNSVMRPDGGFSGP